VEIMTQLKATAPAAACPIRAFLELTEITWIAVATAWARGDYKKAMKLLLPLTDPAAPVAQHRIGVMYVLGSGRGKKIRQGGRVVCQGGDRTGDHHGLGCDCCGAMARKKIAKSGAWFALGEPGRPDRRPGGRYVFYGNGVTQDPVEATSGCSWRRTSSTSIIARRDAGTIRHATHARAACRSAAAREKILSRNAPAPKIFEQGYSFNDSATFL